LPIWTAVPLGLHGQRSPLVRGRCPTGIIRQQDDAIAGEFRVIGGGARGVLRRVARLDGREVDGRLELEFRRRAGGCIEEADAVVLRVTAPEPVERLAAERHGHALGGAASESLFQFFERDATPATRVERTRILLA